MQLRPVGRTTQLKVLAENEQGLVWDKEATFRKYIILGVCSPTLVDEPSNVTSQSLYGDQMRRLGNNITSIYLACKRQVEANENISFIYQRISTTGFHRLKLTDSLQHLFLMVAALQRGAQAHFADEVRRIGFTSQRDALSKMLSAFKMEAHPTFLLVPCALVPTHHVLSPACS